MSREARASDDNKSRLGRGLAALIGDMGEENVVMERARTGQRKIPTAFIKSSPRNPRKTFNESNLEDLTRSIKEKGIVQPIVVRTLGTDIYEIIAGERRWRAAQKAGLHEVPVVLLDVTEREALELAIIENVQRADLDPLEEAGGYEELIAEFKYTQEDLAKVIGKSRSHVANTLRLMNLPDSVKKLLREGKLTAGHARTLLNAPDAEALAQKIAEGGLSVREAESMAQIDKGKPVTARARKSTAKDADTLALEKALTDGLGLRVILKHQGGGGGKVEIAYKNLEQLDELCRRLQKR